MFLVMQSFPKEKVLFASRSAAGASVFFNLQAGHGCGWFELWEEGSDVPIDAGCEQFFSPCHPKKREIMRTVSQMKGYDKKRHRHYFSDEKHNFIVTTWE